MRKIFKINRLKDDTLNGIYIWGDVGRGKTLITKEYLSFNHHLRIKDCHYIDFMNFVHVELNNNSGSKNPLKLVTKSLSKSYNSSGGIGVGNDIFSSNTYFQKFIPGKTFSISFIASDS